MLIPHKPVPCTCLSTAEATMHYIASLQIRSIVSANQQKKKKKQMQKPLSASNVRCTSVYKLKRTYQVGSVSTFFPLKLYSRGACAKNPPCPLNMPFHVLNSTSPLVLATGRSRSAGRTIESKFCTLHQFSRIALRW